MNGGIAVAGSILVDSINEISAYPQLGELTQIKSVKKSVGGCVPNVAIDLKRLNCSLNVKAVGKIGNDENGEYLKATLSSEGVDVSNILYGNDKTSFTQVMSIIGGQRTFFSYAGASANFCANDVDLQNLSVEMLHVGYFLLLDRIDNGDGEKLLKNAKAMGVKTSIDLVSENSNRYSLVLPCLKYVDNLIINEIEAGKLCNIPPCSENLETIAKKLKDAGVCERVIIHTPELSVCYNGKKITKLASYQLPSDYIKGTTGAGDAFCAGALIAIYNQKSDEEILKIATVSATGALSQLDATSGLKNYEILESECKNFKRR